MVLLWSPAISLTSRSIFSNGLPTIGLGQSPVNIRYGVITTNRYLGVIYLSNHFPLAYKPCQMKTVAQQIKMDFFLDRTNLHISRMEGPIPHRLSKPGEGIKCPNGGKLTLTHSSVVRHVQQAGVVTLRTSTSRSSPYISKGPLSPFNTKMTGHSHRTFPQKQKSCIMKETNVIRTFQRRVLWLVQSFIGLIMCKL